MGMGDELNSRLGKPHPASLRSTIKSLCSQKNGSLPSPEDYRTQFYQTYRKEAKEYDEEFIKKYDEDLNTTLIFVSLEHCSSTDVLTWMVGWSILSCDFCLHH